MREFEEIQAFFEACENEPRIGVYHISLFIALVRLRNKGGWENLILINRSEVMRDAKFSRKTYNKCMKDLVELGYLKYEPSNNPVGGSKVWFRKL